MKHLLRSSLLFLAASIVLAQSPAFEVADVHVSAPGTNQGGGFLAGGRVELRAFTMLDLITVAYKVDSPMVYGGPGWLNTDKFDIIAKAPAGTASEETLIAMVKTLLADRFKLEIREEKRDMPVYLMTVAKPGKLQPSTKPGVMHTDRKVVDGMQTLTCSNFKMSDLADLLPNSARNFVDHPVIDETHLDGAYDFALSWQGKAAYLAAKANPDGPPAVSMFDAVEKLGLKLEPAKRPQPVITVVSVNRTPTPNPEGVTAKIPSFPTEFEVAEVRVAKPGTAPPNQAATPPSPLGHANIDNGRVEIMGATLKGLLALALGTDVKNVAGPKWLDDDRFDVIAKTARGVPFEAIQGMLKKELTERFKLATHTEDQPVTVWVLSPGKRAPRLKPADGAERSDCNIVFTDRRNYVCKNTTMAEFVDRLPDVAAAYVRAPIVDLTQIQGAYDFELYWTPKGQLKSATKGAEANASGQASTPADEVTLFEAVDKQLGLKLEEQKRPMPVTVVDRAERVPIER